MTLRKLFFAASTTTALAVAAPVGQFDDHADVGAPKLAGTVKLIGSSRDKARGEAGRRKAYARAATPVTSAQVWKAWVRAARY